MNSWDFFVYTYVPPKSTNIILKEGLYGGEALLKRPDLLELAAKGRNISVKEFAKDIRDNLSSDWKESSQGPNVVFHLIPDSISLPKNHPVKKYKLVPIKINLSKLLHDFPKTKIFGMELEPYSEKVKLKDRHKFLTLKDLLKF